MFIKFVKCDKISLESLTDIEHLKALIIHTCINKYNKLKTNAQQTEGGCSAGVNVPTLTKSDIKHLHIYTSGKVLEILFIMSKMFKSSYVITKRNTLYFDFG